MTAHLREQWRKVSARDDILLASVRIEEESDSADQVRKLIAYVDGRKAGEIQVFGRYYNARARGKIKWIAAYDEFERRGLATYLFEEAQRRWTDLTVSHSSDITPDGREWKRSLGKTALPTWRGFQDDPEPFWTQFDAVIATQPRGRQRYYETWTYGQNFGNYPRLDDAKAGLEAIYGPLPWRREKLPKVWVEHYYFGWTDEFSDPLVIYVVDTLPRLGVRET